MPTRNQVGWSDSANPNCNVDLRGMQVDGPIVDSQNNPHIRILSQEAGKHLGKRAYRKGKRYADPKVAARTADEPTDRVFCFADFVKNASSMTLEEQSRIGQPQVSGRPFNQSRSHRLFEANERATNRGLGHPEGACCRGQGAEIGNARKRSQIIEAQHDGERSTIGTRRLRGAP